MDIIDIIATDHAPHTVEEKSSAKPPPGYPGLETSLPLMLTAVHQGKITLDQVIEKMHHNPKRIFSLPDQPDTYVEVDLDEEWEIPKKTKYTKCGWTPYAGMRVRGAIRRVVLRGEIVYLDGNVLARPGFGQDVRKVPASTAVPAPTPSAPQTPVAPASLTLTSSLAVSSDEVTVPPPHIQQQLLQQQQQQLQHHQVQQLQQHTHAAKLVSASPRAIQSAKLYKEQPVSIPSISKEVVGSFTGTHVLKVAQFTREDMHYLFSVAHEMRMMVKRTGSIDLLKGKILASLFFEPSTRTSCSFQAAMERLGGSVLQVNLQQSSVVKGESLSDTIRTLQSYSDIIVIRHAQAGSAEVAAKVAHKPVINAGDGIGEHPTQALLDVFTIREELGTVNGLTVTLLGDLKHGRTVHSLVRLLSQYKDIKLHYVSPDSLRMPPEIIRELRAKGVEQHEHTDLEQVLPLTKVLYVTRVQKERFETAAQYEKVRDAYTITPATLTRAMPEMIVMHPLPRVNEISVEVDSDPRAAYFRQMENGMYVRMALLAMLLGKA
jgi:carbamoyl-phosphate synthase/aspartate carbamoyltransferase/dihydroorotase